MTCLCPHCAYDRWLTEQIDRETRYALVMATAARDPERIRLATTRMESNDG